MKPVNQTSPVFSIVRTYEDAHITGCHNLIPFRLTFRLLTGFATLAIPEVPSSSMVIVITILSSIGVSTAEVSLLFAVEWFM